MVEASAHDGDTFVRIGIDTGARWHEETRTVFLRGEQGRRRAALAACAALWGALVDPD